MSTNTCREDKVAEDIVRYRDILSSLGDIDDIPPKRRKSLFGEVYKVKAASASQRKSYVSGGADSSKPALRRPSFRPQNAIAVSIKSLNGQEPESQKTTRPSSLSKVGSLRSRATTFEEKTCVDTNYHEMIRRISENAAEIDFGLSFGLLHKNLDYEEQRFKVNFDTSHIEPQNAFSALSYDLENFLKSLGDIGQERDERDAVEYI